MGLRAKTSSSAAVNSHGGGSKLSIASGNCKFLNGNKKHNKSLMPMQNTTKQSGNKTSSSSSSAANLMSKVLPPCLNCKSAVAETTCCSITSIRTTYRSSSTSALLTTAAAASSSSSPSSCMRPQTLNVHNHLETPTDHTQLFLGYVFFYYYFCLF